MDALTTDGFELLYTRAVAGTFTVAKPLFQVQVTLAVAPFFFKRVAENLTFGW